MSPVKGLVNGLCLLLVFPAALVAGFGRFEWIYALNAQAYAMVPGLPGDYLRIAYYRLTLEECSLESRIQFGSFFAHPQARVGKGVYIGSYCVLGRTSIGDRTQIASSVQILSGRHQHPRDAEGRIQGSAHGVFARVSVGSDCWIGAAAIVMEDIGAGTTIGAGSVVTSAIPAGSVAAGNPARILRSPAG